MAVCHRTGELISQKPRPRRIAADEAHAWARNLRLGNPLAKLVLCMLALYVNGEGECFASVNQLADDTELDRKTVMARLDWLEKAGVIRRKPQWTYQRGGRNGEGIGRRTSDLIVLLMDQGEEKSPDMADNSSGPPHVPERSAVRTTKPGLRSVSGPLLVHLGGPPESSEPEPKEGSGDSARERPLISPEAHAFADELALIAGHDPKFLPPQWVSAGPAYRVQMMLDQGWNVEIMRETARATMQRKRDGPPITIRYFEKSFARAHVQQPPLPTAERSHGPPASSDTTNWQRRRDRQHEALAELGAFVDAHADASGNKRSGGDP